MVTTQHHQEVRKGSISHFAEEEELLRSSCLPSKTGFSSRKKLNGSKITLR
jgi:hypothetical protein